MKLSDIKGERVLDVIAELIEPVCNIAMDDKAAAFFKPEKPKKGPDADADGRRASVYAGLAAIDARKHRREVEAAMHAGRGGCEAAEPRSKTCARCGAWFVPRNARQRFCCDDCRAKNSNENRRR